VPLARDGARAADRSSPQDQLDVGGDIAAPGTDVLAAFEQSAIQALLNNAELMDRIRGAGAPWGAVKAFLLEHLPSSLEDRGNLAYRLVPKALDNILGRQGEAWHAFRNERGSTYVRAGRESD
jgi:hypothetical protein